jgi:hypothetical protein
MQPGSNKTNISIAKDCLFMSVTFSLFFSGKRL